MAKTIVLIGKTGTGKSATANTLCGNKLFKSDFSSQSVTKEFQKVSFVFDDADIRLIDSPGIFDCSNSGNISVSTFSKLLEQETTINAFLLIYSLENRFTIEDVETQDMFDSILGESWTRYGIAIFTHADRLKSEDERQRYIRKFPEINQIVQDRFEGRCLFLNNRRKDHETREFLLNYITTFINSKNTAYTKSDLPDGSTRHLDLAKDVEEIERELKVELETARIREAEKLQELKESLERNKTTTNCTICHQALSLHVTCESCGSMCDACKRFHKYAYPDHDHKGVVETGNIKCNHSNLVGRCNVCSETQRYYCLDCNHGFCEDCLEKKHHEGDHLVLDTNRLNNHPIADGHFLVKCTVKVFDNKTDIQLDFPNECIHSPCGQENYTNTTTITLSTEALFYKQHFISIGKTAKKHWKHIEKIPEIQHDIWSFMNLNELSSEKWFKDNNAHILLGLVKAWQREVDIHLRRWRINIKKEAISFAVVKTSFITSMFQEPTLPNAIHENDLNCMIISDEDTVKTREQDGTRQVDNTGETGEDDNRSETGEENNTGKDDNRSETGEENNTGERCEEDNTGEKSEEDNRGETGEEDSTGERGEEDNTGKRVEEDNTGEKGEEDNTGKRGEENNTGKNSDKDNSNKDKRTFGEVKKGEDVGEREEIDTGDDENSGEEVDTH